MGVYKVIKPTHLDRLQGNEWNFKGKNMNWKAEETGREEMNLGKEETYGN